MYTGRFSFDEKRGNSFCEKKKANNKAKSKNISFSVALLN